MCSFLAKAVDALNDYGKKESDVHWVGNEDEKMTWDDFRQHAIAWEHCADIDPSLVIVGDDWHLSCGECYGMEEWCFNTLPTEPEVSNPDLRLVTESYIKEHKKDLARKSYNKRYRENKKKHAS